MTTPEKPEIALNRGGQTVAGALNAFITHAATDFVSGAAVDIATAYFNLGGYSLLADALDHASGVRLLLGAEPQPPEQRRRALRTEPRQADRARRARMRSALDGQEQHLRFDRDNLGFTLEAEATARRLVAWLDDPRVQVRRLEGRFLHGKAFLVGHRSHGVVAGSSNFTHAGLATNLELNLGNYAPTVVGQVQDWFDELWAEAADYDLAALFRAGFEEHSPYLVYLRMLWERYGAEVYDEAAAEDATAIHLTGFQNDGLWRARRVLQERHGVLIADEVGLGKTFLAGALIEDATMGRRQRVLVVAPATLRDGPWRAFMHEHNLPMELVSFEDLTGDSRLNPDHAAGTKLAARDINDYAMVVVDEAHNLRNPSTQRAQALRRLLAGSPPKQLVMLTATPVNNSLWDLYHLLGYFLRNDGAFADAGIRSLRDHFAHAVAMNPDDLTPEHLFDVLDAVAVRRTRSFVKRFYPNDTIRTGGADTPIVFPTPRVHKVVYDLDAVLRDFFDRFAAALDTDSSSAQAGVLTLARYTPSRYRLDGDVDAYETQLAGLLRSMLLKRFESSPHAFAESCHRMAASHDAFLGLLERGRVGTGEALADWMATDSDDMDNKDHDSFSDHLLATSHDAAGYDVDRLRADAARDSDLLRGFEAEARTVRQADDPNLAALVDELADIAAEAEAEGIGADDTRDRRKVLIFSYYADTVDWIVEHLENAVQSDERLAVYRGRIESITGSGGSDDKRSVLWGFAPRTTDAPHGEDADRYDIVVATDVLAEGVNLQQARHIVNYDLPWNPMRLVQRHGRIDRIGSPHREVHLRCVFPDSRLDDLLGLEERLHRRIAQAAATVGVGDVLPDQGASSDVNFTESREEIELLRNEDPGLFERGGTERGTLSGEEFRQELRQAMEDGGLAGQIESLPWKSGSGMSAAVGGRRGYVFCARIGDHPAPLFRFVPRGALVARDEPVSGDGPGAQAAEAQKVVDETLACLHLARPPSGFETPRRLSDDDARRAFEAWEVARADIVEKWNYLADGANLQPRVAPRLARVAAVVREHPPPGMTQDDVDKAVDTICAPYPERTIRTLAAALASSDDPARQAELVLRVIRDLGLAPFVPPDPLPEITGDDVYCVTWLALV
ncbi:helicase-related protein [Candidatus Poriferisodalis sp.]|uniref:helicase-related protein n=1 Tax=Candidatus Poriferisodalis sp. TaxID=3101277 RepID=UPI003B016675